MGPPLHLALLVLLLACSAVVSGSETALFALSRQQLRSFERSEHRFRRLAADLMRRPRRVLMTVLITNTTVNISFFAVSVFLFERIRHTHPLIAGAGAALSPFALVLFSEVLPKAVALAHSGGLAPVTAPVIKALAVALTPVLGVLETVVVVPLTRIIVPGRSEGPRATTGELRALVDMSARQGVINVRENEMLQQIVTLPETSVRSVMVPRVDIAAVSVDEDREEVARRLRQTGKKKLPVFGRDLDDVLGLIHAVDVHIERHRPVRELIRPVRHVPEQADLLHLVQHFRRTSTQLAVVVDEYGGTAGLVSLEDVLEQIVGDITDADEQPGPPQVEAVDERSYRLSGDISVRSLAAYFGLRAGEEGVETLGGFMLARLGRLPRCGDVVRTAGLKLTVERVTSRRVECVRVELVDPTSANGAPAGTS